MHFGEFRQNVPGVMQFLDRARLSRGERTTLLKVGIRLLYQNLTQMGIAVSAMTLMQHFHRLPACINRAYPTYAENGYLRLVVARQKILEKLECSAKTPS